MFHILTPCETTINRIKSLDIPAKDSPLIISQKGKTFLVNGKPANVLLIAEIINENFK